MALIFGKLIVLQEKYRCVMGVTAHASVNPANPYQKYGELRGGLVAHHYIKRLLYMDKRELKGLENIRRLWVIRGEDKARIGGVSAVKITDNGIEDYDDVIGVLTDTEVEMLKK
jgi:hypothetical protein